ncbi:MAG: RimK/LysX family protein [Candidatus Nomurabacteria bacterium]|jgi:glutathione synthase/RimK-type ligase-like ATP-grasp enzyme|nr:RimK/LysX family protein [Candidatus Nomurabacteria bacterium]
MIKRKVLVFSGARSGIKDHVQPLLDYVNKLYKDSTIEFSTAALADLDFYIDGEKTAVRAHKTKVDIANFDLVVFRTVGQYKEEAMAAAIYLNKKGKKFIDSKYPVVSGRLGSTFGRWAADLSIPRTAYGTRKGLLAAFDDIGTPAVLKATNSRKGKDNYLVKSKQELEKLLVDNKDLKFVLQQFIPNDGDYRVLVMDGSQAVVSLRQGKGDTHLNNVSAGGTETLIDAKTVPEAVRLARKAARQEQLQIAGVDIIVDKGTGQPYILEVNRAPQLTVDAEVESFYDVVHKISGSRRSLGHPMEVVGRRVKARMPELNIKRIVAKIDTGAYSSSLHADNIRVENGILKFDIKPSEYVTTKSGAVEHCEFSEFSAQKVRSSTGHLEERYTIKTKFSANSRVFVGTFMLSNRTDLGYPLLIGRRIIRSRFLVNVELDESRKKTWRY